MSQPTVTRSVQHLEACLGAPVFGRGRHGVQPTAVGRVVLRLSTEPELEVLVARLPWIALGSRFGDVFSGVRISFSFPF